VLFGANMLGKVHTLFNNNNNNRKYENSDVHEEKLVETHL
jgi:hypothetical protein